MGILANIYLPAHGDCSNGGISSHAKQVTVVNVSGPFEPTKDAPGVEVRPNKAGRQYGWAAYPVDDVELLQQAEGTPWMFGGALVYTSDSRFAQLFGALTGQPVPLHDRTESWALYAQLSSD